MVDILFVCPLLFIGCFILANNYYKKEIKLENVLNLNNEELKLLEKQTYELLGEDIYIEKKLIDEYIQLVICCNVGMFVKSNFKQFIFYLNNSF